MNQGQSFSRRYGYSKLTVQLDSMDEALKMDIWNLICTVIEATWVSIDTSLNKKLNQDCVDLWCNFLKKDINGFPQPLFYISEIELIYHHKLEWFHIYDLTEYLYAKLEEYGRSEDFKRILNDILEENASAYRLVNSYISPVVDQQAINEIETTINNLNKGSFTYKHLNKAQKCFSDKKEPDYCISCNEALNAIEIFLQEKLNNHKKFVENKNNLSKINVNYQGFWNALDKFYEVRNSNTEHGENNKNQEFTLDDAIFIYRMTCSWISYLQSHFENEKYDGLLS